MSPHIHDALGPTADLLMTQINEHILYHTLRVTTQADSYSVTVLRHGKVEQEKTGLSKECLIAWLEGFLAALRCFLQFPMRQ